MISGLTPYSYKHNSKRHYKMRYYILTIRYLKLFILLICFYSCKEKTNMEGITDSVNLKIENYWNNFNFQDTSYEKTAIKTEKTFEGFIRNLEISSDEIAKRAINNMLSNTLRERNTFVYFWKLYDKYLYDPDSPFLNENLYTTVLQYIISSTQTTDSDKDIATFQLNMIHKNQIGQTANNFTFIQSTGSISSLYQIESEYIILFFNIPDCDECSKTKEIINEFSFSLNKIQTLAIYPGNDTDLWYKTDYPKQWINGYDINQSILSDNLYDLRVFPTIYLLDKYKRVLLKDASIEKLNNYLSKLNLTRKIE